MATDLGYFLQAFNPMDFIKGYEQGEKFATEQDLRKAQARTQAALADVGEVKAEEFKSPQFTKTRSAQDLETQLAALYRGDLARISGEATRAQEQELRTALEADIVGQKFRSESARDRARFEAETGTPHAISERRWQIEQDKRLRTQREQKREDDFRVRLADTAEQLLGVEGRQLVRDVEAGVTEALRTNPRLSEYDALEAMKAGAPTPKLAIINTMQRNAALTDLIKAVDEPLGPRFQTALSRVAPGLSVAGIDPSGGIRFVETVTNEDGTTTTVAAGLVMPSELPDFIQRKAGRLPQTRATPAARAPAATKPPPANPAAEGAARAGETPASAAGQTNAAAATAPTKATGGVAPGSRTPATVFDEIKKLAQGIGITDANDIGDIIRGTQSRARIVGASLRALRNDRSALKELPDEIQKMITQASAVERIREAERLENLMARIAETQRRALALARQTGQAGFAPPPEKKPEPRDLGIAKMLGSAPQVAPNIP